MKNRIILILVLLSFLQSNLFGQKDTFDNNKYFKLTNHYKSKQELFDSGYTEFDLEVAHYYSDKKIKDFKNKYPQLKDFDMINVAPDKKHLLGIKYIDEECSPIIDSICFCDTNGIIYNSYKMKCNGESLFYNLFTTNSEYVYINFFEPCKNVHVYTKQGKKLFEINSPIKQYKKDLFISDDLNKYVCRIDNISKSDSICLHKINGEKLWCVQIDNIKYIMLNIYNDFIVLYGNDNSASEKNIRKLVVLDIKKGNILFTINNIKRVFFYEKKFLVWRKMKAGNEYDEYEILD